ncbi:MAG: HAMP domain-containing protein [Bacteroidia bacterium]|nr:HAMP domain-containing protein [Bacteroidia bacterium]
MAKKQTTVFRQLITNIVIPLIISVGFFSGISYYYNKKELEKNYAEAKARILRETEDLLSVYDYSMNMHEEQFSKRMREVNDFIINDVKKNAKNPATLDLNEVVKKLELDTNLHAIYILDTPCVIVNTTFKRDLGLDFAKMNSVFIKFFSDTRKNKKFIEDRFARERATWKIKKYTYAPFADGRFVLELGFYSDKAWSLNKLLLEKVESISKQYGEIKSVNLMMGILNATDKSTPPEFMNSYTECLRLKKAVHAEQIKGDSKEYIDFLFISMAKTTMFDGYVVQIISNDSKERELVRNELRKFGFIFLVTVIPLIVLIYFRARKITNPIKKLINKVQVISSGNLDERIEEEGHNEITELSKDFNQMVDKLQESYEGLEQKVKDRTAEISHQKELVEEKQKEIVDSIKYAKRIQVALITSEIYFERNLKRLNKK